MALFLQESIEETTEILSIEEAYEGLIEASMDINELTETLLYNDFTLNEECKVLTEAEEADKKENFLIVAAKKIKEFIIKAKDRVIEFLKTIGTRMKDMWTKLITKGGKVTVVKGSVQEAEKIIKLSQSVDTAVNSSETNPTKYKQAVDVATNAFNKALEQSKKLVMSKQENSDVEVIDVNKLKNLFAIGSVIIGSTAFVQSRMTKNIADVESVEKKATLRSRLFSKASREEKKRMKLEQKQKDAPIMELARSQALSMIKGSGIKGKATKFAINTLFNKASKKVKI